MNVIKYIFVSLFLCIILLPILFIDTKSTYSIQENRMLAAIPHFTREGAHLFQQIDEYINDRLGFKRKLVLFYRIVRGNKNETVLIGKNNWLFYIDKYDGDNLSDFQKNNLFDTETINRFFINIEERIRWCDEHEIQFLFIIGPNKHNIYSEYVPLERPEGLTRTEKLMQNIPSHLRDRIIFPQEYLLLQKQYTPVPLYYETDTHWNKLGAYYAFELLYEKIKALFPHLVFPTITYHQTVEEQVGEGDLVPNLGLVKFGKKTEIHIEPMDGWDAYFSYIKNDIENGKRIIITENSNTDLPKAIIFRDSFFNALQPFASSIFSRMEYHGSHFTTHTKDFILENKPDIIIWEVVERYIPHILDTYWE